MTNNNLRSLTLLFVIACVNACSTGDTDNNDAGPVDDCQEPCEREWYQFGLSDPILDQVALYYLGHVYDGSADVGEILETISRVDSSDPYSWSREWINTATRLISLAEESQASDHPLSASNAYLRGATYYRAALHRHPDPYANEVAEVTEFAVNAFGNYLTLSGSPCRTVSIPYESTTLLGYLCRSPVAQGPAPILLFHEGRDGWAEDGKFIADEAMRRGYHALLFDGPGMGKTLRRQGLPFRPDWEKVITPVIDFAIDQAEVDPDRIGLISLSMGGFLGPRAAAFEPRLSVLVANPGVIDWSIIVESFLDALDPELLPLLETSPEAFDEALYMYMQADDFLRWGMVDFMWHHGVDTPSDLVMDLQRYDIGEHVKDITARTLVIDAESESWGQSVAFYDALTCPKDYVMFTSAEAAQFHVQVGASAIFAHRLFDWLDDNL